MSIIINVTLKELLLDHDQHCLIHIIITPVQTQHAHKHHNHHSLLLLHTSNRYNNPQPNMIIC